MKLRGGNRMSMNLHEVSAIPAATLWLVSVLFASACDAPEDPDPNVMSGTEMEAAASPAGFRIEKVTTNGKGCPNPDSVDIVMSPDDALVRIIHHDMFLEQSPGEFIQQTSCTMTLDLQVPAGWKVAPKFVGTRGFAQLDDGIYAR